MKTRAWVSVSFAFVLAFLGAGAGMAESLEAGFLAPPGSARPWVFWIWINGNVTKEGIRADLEDMKRTGIGGALLFDAAMSLPKGPVRYGSDAWHEHVQYAISVADELGLKVGIMNCAGWATSGGPWVKVEHSMKELVWSETTVSGSPVWRGSLAQPTTRLGFYRDVAVLAVPDRSAAEEAGSAITGRPGQAGRGRESGGAVDGSTAFSEGDPETRTAAPAGVRPSRIPHLTMKTGLKPQMEDSAYGDGHRSDAGEKPSFPAAIGVDGEFAVTDVIDLTTQMAPDGALEWTPPAGRWTVLRIGYTTTGRTNHPAAPEGEGLEVDKFDAAAVADHFEHGVGRIIREAGAHAGHSLAGVLFDSWEAGPQNWTDAMPAEFARRRGYAMGPWLACLTGRVVGSSAEAEAFLEDFRRTLGELYAEEDFGTFRRLAVAHGLELFSESYGGALDELRCNAFVDQPAAEFWSMDEPRREGGRRTSLFKGFGTTVSAAHTLGRRIVSAEAFTSRPPRSQWGQLPANLKELGDAAYADGINRFYLHSYVHQPRLDVAPGFTHGRYGTPFGRLNTWWALARPWMQYMARTQGLLQYGQPVADLLFLYPERLQSELRDLASPAPAGYHGDYLAPWQLPGLRVENGALALPAGTTYRVLVVPEHWTASLETLRELRRLRVAGATIVGPAPFAPAGLLDLQRRHDDWRAAVAGLWPEVGREPEITRPALARVLRERGIVEDFRATVAETELLFAHRAEDGVDVYFISNQSGRAITTDAELRATGRSPELWDAVSGTISPAPRWQADGSRTRVTLALAPGDAVFVVFRKPLGAGRAASGTEIGSEPARGSHPQRGNANGKAHGDSLSLPIAGPWRVEFQPGRGAPAVVMTDRLVALNMHPDPGVRYFSGLATYRTTFSFTPRRNAEAVRFQLDLGVVRELASIELNGQAVGGLWRPPFVVDVTDALQRGENTLVITVANTWVNRLVGDEQCADDARFDERAGSVNQGGLLQFPTWWPNPAALRQSGRVAFATWKHVRADTPLPVSGLIGPVRLTEVKAAPEVR